MRVILIASTQVNNFIPEYIFNENESEFLAEPDELAEMSGRLDYLS